jgi:DNA-directed RNA polymerase subunit omega
MKSQYINAAANVISNKQQLINMVSKRVRELSAGSRPMVEINYEIGQMGLADIALAEIAAGKLTAQPAVELDPAHAA